MIIKKLMKMILQRLPITWKLSFFLKSIDLKNFPSELEIKLAETEEEVFAAMGIVYGSYLQLGVISPNDYRLHVSKYHLLPTTSVLVAKWNGETVATISMIPDSDIGLPSESCWNLKEERRRNRRLCELGNLAVKKEYRNKKIILLSLFKYAAYFAENYLGVDCFIATTRASVSHYYEMLFGARKNDEGAKIYGGVKYGGLSLVTSIPLSQVRPHIKSFFGRVQNSEEYYSFFCDKELKEFEYPPKKELQAFYPSLNYQSLQRLLFSTSSLLKDISGEEKERLKESYLSPEISKQLKEVESSWLNRRDSIRFVTYYPVDIYFDRGNSQKGEATLLNASKEGAFLICSERMMNVIGERVGIIIPFTHRDNIYLEVEFVRELNKCQNFGYGLKVIGGDLKQWHKLIDEMESDYFYRAA